MNKELINSVLQAGEKILEIYHSADFGVETKKDDSPLTKADLESHNELVKYLETTGIPIISEEGIVPDYKERKNYKQYWLIDPLDGTNAFMCGLPCWGFALGLVDGEQPEFGLVYLPLTDELYYTGVEGRVYRNGKPCAPEAAAPLDNEAVLYVPSDAHRRYAITFPGKIRSLGSAAYHGILTARASTAGVLQGRIRLWDAAAVLAINKAWGIQAGTLDGNPVRISHWQVDKALKEPLFFCHPENFAAVASTIRML